VATKYEKYRKPISRVMAIFCLLIIIFTKSKNENVYFLEISEIIGYILLSIATLGRIWSAIYISGIKNDKLCMDGPYSMMRNPLYLFSFLGMIGAAWGAENIPLSILLAPIFIIYYYYVVKSEEERLLRIFGKEFQEYCNKVPRFFPKLKFYRSRDKVEVNPRLLMKNTIEAMCFVYFLFFLEILEFLKGSEAGSHKLIPTLINLPF
jgi:protein-S-isoprenylcysteine O-methyltransferase Ste14